MDVGARAEVDILAAQADELRDPEAGLEGEGEEGMVTTAQPSGEVRGFEQGVGFSRAEERHHGVLGPVHRYGQHTLDERCVLGVLDGQVAEQ